MSVLGPKGAGLLKNSGAPSDEAKAPAIADDDAPLAAPSDSLGARAKSGAAATGAAQLVKVATQFISVVVLARLLPPSEFGLFAMVMPITAFIMLFQDLGLAQAVVTSTTITRRQASTLFWVNVGLSTALAVVLALTAPLIAAFYGEPRLTALTLALAVTVVIAGLGAQHLALLNREMRFGRLAIMDIAATVGGFAVAVVIAVFAPTVWALVASTVTTMAVMMLGAWASSRWRPGKPARLRDVGAMLRFGGGLTTFNLTNFLSRNLDRVMIGRVAGAASVGLYDRAYKLLLLPLQQINAPLSRVMVPVLSRLRGEDERYLAAYRRAVGQILLIATPGVLFLVICAERVIPLLMGEAWRDAAPIFVWLGIAGLHQPMTATLGWLFISQQRTGEFARWGLFNAVTCIAAFAVGLPWGALGVAAAYAISDTVLRLPVLWWWVGRKGPVRVRHLAGLALPYAAGLAVAGAVVFPLRNLSLGAPVLDLAILAALAYLAAWATAAAFPGGRHALGDSIGLGRQILARVTRR